MKLTLLLCLSPLLISETTSFDFSISEVKDGWKSWKTFSQSPIGEKDMFSADNKGNLYEFYQNKNENGNICIKKIFSDPHFNKNNENQPNTKNIKKSHKVPTSPFMETPTFDSLGNMYVGTSFGIYMSIPDYNHQYNKFLLVKNSANIYDSSSPVFDHNNNIFITSELKGNKTLYYGKMPWLNEIHVKEYLNNTPSDKGSLLAPVVGYLGKNNTEYLTYTDHDNLYFSVIKDDSISSGIKPSHINTGSTYDHTVRLHLIQQPFFDGSGSLYISTSNGIYSFLHKTNRLYIMQSGSNLKTPSIFKNKMYFSDYYGMYREDVNSYNGESPAVAHNLELVNKKTLYHTNELFESPQFFTKYNWKWPYTIALISWKKIYQDG